MISIRRNVFETNSSSTHSLCICTQEEYDKWKNKEAIFDTWNEKIISAEDYLKLKDEYVKEDCRTYDEYYYDTYLEWYEQKFTTPSGDRMVAFGKYGYDG